MPVYTVKIWYNNSVVLEVEAKDKEEARDKAIEELYEDVCPDDVVDTQVQLCDSQYTDEQELRDREEGADEC